MILFGFAKVGLFEDEWHAQQSLPEIDGNLFGRTNDGDVVQALHLNLLHGWCVES